MRRSGAGFGIFLTGLVIGLIAGPVIGVWLGFMAYKGERADVARRAGQQTSLRDALVSVQASLCAVRARTEVPNPAGLDYNERWKLAERWAVMAGELQGEADNQVKHACAELLAQAPTDPPAGQQSQRPPS
ncbi:MAG: DUF456 domain-containing protein [Candidatus Tectomicrobia bacterium]|uniref:DUF456 domain-containing protein n=1 Tax=Tectimicrobiota bacterium TaxID=2528274 RepID=A0A932MM40_UNCTE|nr:DUF456 domain-containing protein [Candidatus Tectomicrobia bacterium]